MNERCGPSPIFKVSSNHRQRQLSWADLRLCPPLVHCDEELFRLRADSSGSLPSIGLAGQEQWHSTLRSRTAIGTKCQNAAVQWRLCKGLRSPHVMKPNASTSQLEVLADRPRSTAIKVAAHISSVTAAYLGASLVPNLTLCLNKDSCESQGVVTSARLRNELARLRTGDDAISFFSRYGSHISMQGEFVYCIRALTQDSFCPYSLTIVPKDHVQQEYFSISGSGVVHFQSGQPSECSSLADWSRQSFISRVLSSMPLFRLHLHRKALARWKAGARYSSFCRNRRSLSQRCFLAKPAFAASLMHIRGVLSEVERVTVFHIPQCCLLGEFAELQHTARRHPVIGAQVVLDRLQASLVSLLQQLVETVEAPLEAVPHCLPAVSARARRSSKSIVREKEESRQHACMIRMQRFDIARLQDCVDLVACMFHAALIAVARDGISLLRRWVAQPDHLRGLLFVSVSFVEHSNADGTVVRMSTSADACFDICRRVWEDSIQLLEAVPSIGLGRAPGSHTRIFVDTVGTFLRRDPRCVCAALQFGEALALVLGEAEDYADRTFGPLIRIREYGQRWDADVYMSLEHTTEDLLNDLSLMQGFRNDLSRIRSQRTFGVLHMDGESLRSELEEVPAIAVASMERALMALAHKSCVQVCETLQAELAKLEERAKGCDAVQDEAIACVCNAMSHRGEILAAEVEGVRELYELLRSRGVQISAKDQLGLYTLEDKEESFTKALGAALLFIQRRVHERSNALGKQLSVAVQPRTTNDPFADYEPH